MFKDSERVIQLSQDWTRLQHDEWQPPTEAELKVLQAKRERSDKISKIMGDYLLKGYKMLGSTCAKCGTILLKDREGTDYCIACMELDSDADKDDPALSADAARAQAAEQGQRGVQSDDSDDWEQPPSRPLPPRQQPPTRQLPPRADAGAAATVPALLNGNSRQPVDDQDDVCYSVSDLPPTGNPVPIPLRQARERLRTQTSGSYQCLLRADCCDTISVLKGKIEWATRELSQSSSVEYSTQICRMITASADAIAALENASVKV